MLIHEWEVWHAYSSWLTQPVNDLQGAAHRLVRAGVLPAAFCSDGHAVWRAPSGVLTGNVVVEGDPGITETTIKIPGSADGFALESLVQSAKMRFEELCVFGADAPLPLPYLRGLVGECVLFSPESDDYPLVRLTAYPMVKVYRTGDLTVSIRLIGPPEAVDLEVFIRDAVLAFHRGFQFAAVPPALARLAPRAQMPAWQYRWFRRRRLISELARHDRAVDELTHRGKPGDFELELAPLTSAPEHSEPESVRTLALTVMAVVGYVLGSPREGLRLAALGQRRPPEIGADWIGRPHVYLIRHEDQEETAPENEQQHRDHFARIVAGVSTPGGPGLRRYLPPNARLFGDYGAYIGGPSTLWVWSERGRRQRAALPWADVNRGHFVYPHQVITEFLDFGYTVHRRLAHKAGRRGAAADDVLRAQHDALGLELAMAEASHFGELRELFEQGWSAMGVPRLRDWVRQSLSVRHNEAGVIEARRAVRWTALLTTVFGLVAVPALATDVLGPLWAWANWPLPANRNEASLVLTAAALLIVLAALGAAFLWHRRADPPWIEPVSR